MEAFVSDRQIKTEDKYCEKVRKVAFPEGGGGSTMADAVRRILSLYPLPPGVIEKILADSPNCSEIVGDDGTLLYIDLYTFLERKERTIPEILEAAMPLREKMSFAAYREKVLAWLVNEERISVEEAPNWIDEAELGQYYDEGLSPQTAAQILIA